MENLKEVVRPFYTKCLTVNNEVNPSEILENLLANDFQSYNTKETKGKVQLMGQIAGFWKMMPDLKWEVQEMIQEENKVVVRSIFSGSPKGNFMGMELDGTILFKTMSIDIHTVENGQIKSVYHCEDWTTAIAQLRGIVAFGLIHQMDQSNPFSDIEARIHPADEMYSFFTTHPLHRDTPLKSYFESGEGLLRNLLEILKRTGIRIEEVGRFLEFACGYGRFTRFLVTVLPPEKITGSDVYKEAVDFQKSVFGVKGFYSAFNPDEVNIPEKYDVIFVASLFSHLPATTWRLWLKKLYFALNDQGVLIFSVHGPSCMASPEEMPESGFFCCRMSESTIHSLDDYATTYVTPQFVHRSILEETGQPVLLEIPKGMWNYQDVYVVRKS